MKNRLRFSIVALASAAGLAQAQDFPQAFDDIAALTSTGNWFTRNNSTPVGLTNYFQGNTAVFPAQASAGYLGTNFNNCGGTGTISNWFVTPTLGLQNGQQFTFWTRDGAQEMWPDRLQIRASTNGFSTNVGTLATDVGDFTRLLLDINPEYLVANYPSVWTQFTVTLSGLPAGTTNGRIAFRYFVENGGPTGANSDYIGIDEANYNGLVVPPPTGACCRVNGTCDVGGETACTGGGGVYQGNNVACGSVTCPVVGYIEGGTDVGDLPGTAALVNGSGQPLTVIIGNIDLDDVDMYKMRICNEGSFSATTNGGTTLDTMLWLFNSTGRGVVMSDDTSATVFAVSTITSQFVTTNGDYYLAISTFNNTAPGNGRVPLDVSSQALWNPTGPNGQVYPEWVPNGPGAANPVSFWNGATADTGSYRIFLTGACFLGGTTCYPNCDGVGGLTANDFQCFLDAFAANQTYANCDGVGGLTANDFQCFLNAFAAGCT